MINLKGERVRQFFTSETKALLATYKNIQTLLPASERNGSAHTAEEGRYIESLIRSYLNKHLPDDLRAFSGFILRPATKFGNNNRTRRLTEIDKHSNQIDILVYDVKNYPIYEQFEEFVIVPPEGVISIISVKKNLYKNQLTQELYSLKKAAQLCNLKNSKDETIIGPNTCLLSISNKVFPNKTHAEISKSIFTNISSVHNDSTFDQCLNTVIVLDSFTIFKRRPEETAFDNLANYLSYDHSQEKHYHYGIQFLITGILAVYYHPSRKVEARPGFTSFPTEKCPNINLGSIVVKKLR